MKTVAGSLVFPFCTVVLPLAIGAVFGHRVPQRDRLSKRLVFLCMVSAYPAVTFLSGWRVTVARDLIWLPVAGMVVSLAGLGIGWVLSHLHRWPGGGRSRCAYIFGVGLNNMGHTGGAVICFAFLGEEALAQAVVLLLHWQFLVYLVCFPLAKHFSDAHQRLSPLHELLAALRDPRLLPLAGLLAGLAVNLLGVPRPEVLRPVNSVLIAVAAFTASFAVGITIRVERFRDYGPLYVSQFVGKFALLPAFCWVLSRAVSLSPLAQKVVMIQGSCPQAFYAVFLVHFFDLDHHLANSMFIVNSLLYLVFVLPALAWLL